MTIWLVGDACQDDFAGSAYDRIINQKLRGRPMEADGAAARDIIALATELAPTTAVLHDISTGGLAVALTEIAIKSNLGVSVDGLSTAELLDETPLRFLAVTYSAHLEAAVPHQRIGTMGGSTIDFGTAGSISLSEARAVWANAIPRRMR